MVYAHGTGNCAEIGFMDKVGHGLQECTPCFRVVAENGEIAALPTNISFVQNYLIMAEKVEFQFLQSGNQLLAIDRFFYHDKGENEDGVIWVGPPQRRRTTLVRIDNILGESAHAPYPGIFIWRSHLFMPATKIPTSRM